MAVAVVLVLALVPSLPAGVVLSEIHYHPPAPAGEILEFAELMNVGDREVSLAGWRFTAGVRYVFPAGASIAPGGFVVVCRDRDAFLRAFGLPGHGVFGDYSGALADRGETLTLVDANGAWVDGVDWDDAAPWPAEADGEGSSLQRVCASAPSGTARNWSGAFAELPTPMSANPQAGCPLPPFARPRVAITEINYHPRGDDPVPLDTEPTVSPGFESGEFLELHVPGDEPVDVSGWTIAGLDFTLPAGTTIPAGGYLCVCRDEAFIREAFGIDNTVGDYPGVLANGGERVALIDLAGRVVDHVSYRDDGDWPIAADGEGRSLERISLDVEAADPANWRPTSLRAGEFVEASATGTLTSLTAQRVLVGINGVGEFIVDDVILESVAEPGVNLVPNGDFEAGLDEWNPRRNTEGSTVEDGVGVDGSRGLRVVSTGVCGDSCDVCPSTQSVSLRIERLDDEQEYRLSFRYRYVGGSQQVYCRVLRGVGVCVGEALSTPGEGSRVESAELLPFLSERGRSPAEPTSSDATLLSVRARSPAGRSIETVELEYRVEGTDDGRRVLPMFDDGRHGDAFAGDGVWGVELPALPHDTVVLYRFVARTTGPDAAVGVSPLTRESRADPWSPEAQHPEEVWGYYVNDDQPDSPLPVWHVLFDGVDPSDPLDINSMLTCLRLEPAHFVYGGDVWPHVGIRFRGNTACVLEKRNLKLKFHRGREFKGWKKANLQGIWTDKALVREHVAWEFIRQLAIPACETEYIRVHLNGQYHGLFLYLEHPDERFFERNGLSGHDCLYKARQPNTGGDTPIGVSRQPSVGAYAAYWEQETCESGDFTPIAGFIDALHSDGLQAGGPTADFFLQHSKPRELIAYQIAQAALNNIDSFAKNHFLYLDRSRGRWSMLTWDMDLVFGKNFDGRLNRPNPRRVGTINDCMLSPLRDLNPWFASTVRGNPRLHWFVDFFFRADRDFFQRAYLVRLWNVLLEKFSNENLDPYIDDLAALLANEQAEDFERWGRTPVTCWPGCGNCAEAIDMAGSIEIVKEQIGFHREFLFAYIRRQHPEIPDHARMQITEILYDPRGRSEDLEFIELLNTTDREIDIGGWSIQFGPGHGSGLGDDPEEATRFEFPASTAVPPDGVVLLVGDRRRFLAEHPGIEARASVFEYGGSIDNDGETLRLLDAGPGYPATIDLVSFDDGKRDWPDVRDGHSIELVDAGPMRDNDLGAAWIESPLIGGSPGDVAGAALPTFTRGDVNADDVIHIGDPVRILHFLFGGGSQPRCPDAADVDDDGQVGVGDVTHLLAYLFLQGPRPSEPYPGPGADPTPDALGCGAP